MIIFHGIQLYINKKACEETKLLKFHSCDKLDYHSWQLITELHLIDNSMLIANEALFER